MRIFRIATELITNSLAHSNCTKIAFNFERNMNSVIMRFEDDGIGFDYDKVSSQGRHGLTNIESRTSMLEGSGKWKPSEKGTNFVLTIPIKRNDN